MITAVAHPLAARSRVWLETLQELEQRGVVLKTESSRFAGHSRELAAQLAGQAELMLVLGGDGTIHEVVNGLFDQSGPRPTLCLVPLGTGNDLCRGLGVRLEKDRLVQTVLKGVRRQMDLGRLTCDGGRVLFGCTCSAGFAAEVARRTDELATKSKLRGLSYSVALLLCLTGFKSPRAHFTIDGTEHRAPLLFNLNLCNTRYYGGGMTAAPRAEPFDGELDMVSMELNRLQVLQALPRNYSGNFGGIAGVVQQRVRRLRLETDPPVLVQADGQIVGRTPLEVEVVPAALELVLPP
ncbi:diacylglycerol kinase family lipid kinase [bacterium CPR1]|nr:diacylglycerol kinase family lipid kinase [bacterium CPR1]